MYDWTLEEMDRIRDLYRTFHWSKRIWPDMGDTFYMNQPFAFSNLPDGFPFQHECIHADGSYTVSRVTEIGGRTMFPMWCFSLSKLNQNRSRPV